MDDLISRAEAIDAVSEGCQEWRGIFSRCETNLLSLPSAQPEQKRGRWIEYINSHCECPFCHKEWSYFDNDVECFNFCPNCGADMRGENE